MDENKGEIAQEAASSCSVTKTETSFSKAVSLCTRYLSAVAGLLFVLERVISAIVRICHEAGLCK